MWARRLDGGPGEAAIAIELAPFHGNPDRAAVGIAEHGLESRSEHGVEQLREVVALGRCAGRADRDLAALGVLDRSHAALAPGDAGRDVAVHASEPAEFLRVIARLYLAVERLRHETWPRMRDHAAIARRDIVEVVEHDDAAGARHVLRHQHGLARNVLAEVARQEPQVEIVAGADAVANQHAHPLVLVETLDRGLGLT